MLLTRNEDEIPGIGPLVGDGLHAWNTVLLQPDCPFYVVRFSIKDLDEWKVNMFLVANEIRLAGFCYSVAKDHLRRIEDVTQLVTRGSVTQQSCELTKIGEIWEAEEPLDGETGCTTVLLLNDNGKSVGSDSRSLDEVKIRSKCFPIKE